MSLTIEMSVKKVIDKLFMYIISTFIDGFN